MTTERLNALPSDYQLHWYRIERVLGQGGFGITYLARDTNLEQLVAIKEYLPVEFAARAQNDTVQARTQEHQDRYEWGLERFISEARTLARFDHPNIVRVYSVFEHNNTAYMVMRYEQGENLQSVLVRRKVFEEDALRNIVLPILEGLEEIHRAGFIHRDIKPDNIYIRDDKTPVLLDFGSARQAFGDARTLTILVAPGYAPFEQYYSNSDQQGPWTDIYSLGATLYRAVTGAPPADAIARSKGILGSTRDILVPAAQAAQGRFSQTLLRAIDHALEFNERERPQSIAEWRSELLATSTDMPSAPERAHQASNGAALDRRNGSSSPAAMEAEPYDPAKAALPTTVAPDDDTGSPAGVSPIPAAKSRWARVGSLVAIAIVAVVAGLFIGPYLRDESRPTGDGTAFDELLKRVEDLEKGKTKAEKDRQEAEKNKRQAEEEKRKAEQLAEEEKRKAAEATRLAEEEKRKAAEAKRLAEEEKQKRLAHEQQQETESKRLAEEQKRKDEATRRLAEEKQRDADLALQRAEEDARRETARRRDAEIVGLLAAAKTDLASNRLSTPPGNNALEGYRFVLELDPANARAAEGIDNIVARYTELADQATMRRDFDRARRYLDKADAIVAGTATVAMARKRLADEEQWAQTANLRDESPATDVAREPTASEKLDLAVAAYEKDEFSDARRQLEPLADEHGLPRASYYLGLMYARGDGVARSNTEAVRHYREAAEQGYAPAQKSLGVMYATGRGVPRDDAEAFKWYTRAAEQGNADAQINLGNMYADGLGVAQSDFQAYAWFAVAAASGNSIAVNRRDAVEKRLQPMELEHARKLARQYKMKYPVSQ